VSSISRTDLLEYLANLASVGRVVPCWSDPLAGWISEDAREIRAAKRLCASCPAFDGCREYGTGEGRREYGVYAGEGMTQRLNRSKTNPTETDI